MWLVYLFLCLLVSLPLVLLTAAARVGIITTQRGAINWAWQHERSFRNWEEESNGGRRYWKDYTGRRGGWARYVKIVDTEERTLSVVQEIYDRNGNLVEVHEKFPVDKGHRKA